MDLAPQENDLSHGMNDTNSIVAQQRSFSVPTLIVDSERSLEDLAIASTLFNLSSADSQSAGELRPRTGIGATGVVTAVETVNPLLRNKLLSMGIVRGTLVEVVQIAPLGDPISIKVRGFILSLRRQEARAIRISA